MFAAGKTTSGVAAQTYVDDVFSTWLYTGTGATQTITNGIDLAGQGGLVWIKPRAVVSNHWLFDTARGVLNRLIANTNVAGGVVADTLTSFNNNGFSMGANTFFNVAGEPGVSWTFRKAPKFFDAVTYTGNGANRTVAHSLGQVPGMIVVKRTDTTGDWEVYHRSLANTEYAVLNTTAAKATDATMWNSTTATASVFSLGTNTNVNANTGTYVAYLFAHDTATDGIIQCGSYTGNGSATGPTVTLGWEPQWVLIKRASGGTGNWVLMDSMRGMTVGGQDPQLNPNLTDAENNTINTSVLSPTATGFVLDTSNTTVNGSGFTYIYVAIRRPNKPPTTGTQVFMPTVYTGTNVDNRLVDTTIAPDMVWVRQRNDSGLAGVVVGDRLRGQPYLLTGSTAAEVTDADAFDQQIVVTTEYGTAFSSMSGFWVGNDPTAKLNVSTVANNQIAEAFKRAPGVFDVVCYTGTTAQQTVSHNLSAVPELIIAKIRGNIRDWVVYYGTLDKYLLLNTSDPLATDAGYIVSTSTSNFVVGASETLLNENAENYVAYLFATSPGISKVFSYTGNGSSQTINCGFTTGARFVLIKRTDATGSWYFWDSARGIVAGNDPFLSLNGTGAENTSYDTVDTDSTGFVVNSDLQGMNTTSATYIGLAFA